ncbi:amino acid adenylation domain-containing protein, partial [Dactylosporangium sp. NPDC049140]|uniref:amino acid adenylation domain-containing protein n=1 Tax=Dactylosporangium sp. NPDC049140 TaxID=3155647 RepID=UPI0033E347A2
MSQVGVHDDFFALGGHSLLATQVVSRVRQVFGVEIPVAAVFDAPTVAQLAAVVDAAAPGVQAAPVVPVGRDVPLPLSFAQQRLWFLAQLDPGSIEYNTPASIPFSGALDADALQAALNALVARHEVLRTRLVAGADGEPYQVVDPPTDFVLPVLDISDAAEAEAWLALDAAVPFDLATGPLFRATLLRLAPDEHILALAMHHVVADEWSFGILRRELDALYAGAVLEPLPVQYADFAVWQRARLTGDVLATQLDYWRGHLDGVPTLELPTDRPRPAVRTGDGASIDFAVPAEVADRLRAVARDGGASMFMTVLSAFTVLLGRYSGQDDIVVGTPIAGRTRAETEGLIGFFLNTLALRTDLSGDPTLTELLGRVRTGTLAAYAHQELPFEHLVDALGAPRDRSRTPLFQVLFNYDSDDGRGRFAGWEPTAEPRPEPMPVRYDVSVSVVEADGALVGSVQYATALFDDARMIRFVRHFQQVLAELAADADRRLSQVALLTDPEVHELTGWSDGGPAVPWTGAVHELVAARAAATPDAVAVQSLSYRELWRRAAGLSARLTAQGVGPESIVGLRLDRGSDFAVAALAVWQAGGTYLPLDPDLPAERLSYILADSGAEVVLDSPLGEVELLDAVPCPVSPLQAAYVIYTSGSTGRPKGVTVSHGNLASFLGAMADRPGLSADDVLLAVTTFGFDIAGLEMWLPLIRGARVVVADRDEVRAPHRLAELIGEHGVSVLQATPATWQMLVEDGWAGSAGLRVLCGGEALPGSLAAALVQRAGSVWNMYGPTETTVWSAVDQVTAGAPVTLGSPIAGTRWYVLDASLREVPAGVVGELYIGGAGVARGYLGRPELTAERFVADRDGARLYRTGDLARWRSDGRPEFLGRADFQVKVRGFRIELGEVEAAIRDQAGVSAAVVVADGSRLVAYVVGQCSVDGLRERLPDYMVPSVFVEMTSLPLNANGKVDRKALPAPDAPVAGEYVAPRTVVEEAVAGVWGAVLGVERVGVFDDFFALGGHSLLATRVVSRIRSLFSVEVPVAALFDAPTVAGLAAAVDTAGPGIGTAPIVPVGRDRALPLSFAQQRLWFLAQLDPGSAEYNLPMPIGFDGELSRPALTAALGALITRHETLRTRFAADADGEPYQVIEPPAPFELPFVDLSTEDDGEAAARAWLARDAVAPFDLADGVPLRATLLRVAADRHVLALVLHHVISDDWSAGILHDELWALYAGEAELPPLPVQYADFAVWQRAWLTGDVLRGQLGYWRERLDGLPVLELPTDRPRPSRRSNAGAAIDFAVPAGVTEALRAVSRTAGASMFMTALSAFSLLLGRYTGQDDIAIGTPIANRNRSEIEGLIGLFVNTLVLRTDLSGDPTFDELLARVRAGTLAAHAHQDLPFEHLVDALGVPRDRSRTPLFQVLFNYATEDGGRVLAAGQSEPEPVPVQFDLSVTLTEAGDGLAGAVHYSTALFDDARIVRLIGHFQQVLAAVAGDAGRRLSQVPLLGVAEAADLATWSSGGPAVPWTGAVHELVAARAAATPDAVAVQSLSYRELWRRAAGLSARLTAEGVGPESIVGLRLDRGPDFAVAALAVWQAGGTYLPLDPDLPAERLSYILADSGAEVVLDSPLGEIQPVDAPPVPVSPLQAAYVIYTSGSTGRPKGVTVSHGNLASFLGAMADRPGLSADDVLLAVTTFGFDIAGLEMWLPLIRGARVVVADRDEVRAPRRLAELIDEHGVSVLQATPATWQMLVEDGWAGSAGLRVLCGGEALPGSLAAALVQRAGSVWNMYGPTETTVWSAVDEVTAGAPVTLGSPIAGTRWFVLDASLREVPAGVVGELYIGGAGVARGYLGRPELTAERFVADRDGARLYRTGDLARWRSDGRPEFLGRADFQVKVRGFRIELGEVEAAIRDQAGVSAAVVVADGARLVAYVVGQCSVDGLRERLPDYMVPAVFVEMTALPLNANGKVDRRALPAPDAPAVTAEYVAPRTPVEEAIAEVWGTVLGVERVGLFDDFFALGGHSLLATRVVSRIRSVFGVEVPVAALFDAPTVAGLAAAVDTAGPGIGTAPIVPVGRDRALPLSFAQQRLWFLAQVDGAAQFNLPMPIRFSGDGLSVEALRAALGALLARHEVLRTRLVAGADGVPYQVIDPPAEFLLPVVDLSADGPAAAEAWLAADAVAPFDLAAGPLLRATLLRLAPDEHVLSLTMHHVAGDEWSAGILRRELDALYTGAELAPLPVQYADFAVWQRRWLTGEVLDGQLAYWRGHLEDAPALELPADRPRPPRPDGDGSAIEFVVPADVVEGLRAVSRAAGASMFMTVYAAFAALLGRYSGQDDIVVGTPIAGRTRAEIEGLIGFFVNTLVLRTDLSGDPTVAELVGRVRTETLAAYANQDLPFEQLVDELGARRDLSRTPLFQVLFNYVAAEWAGEELPEVAGEPTPVRVKFDLSMAVDEVGDGLLGSLRYSTALFDDARMIRMVGHFNELLAAVAADAGRRLSRLPVLSPAEVADFARWNDTATVLPRGETVLDLIASQDPAAVAVRAGDTALT